MKYHLNKEEKNNGIHINQSNKNFLVILVASIRIINGSCLYALEHQLIRVVDIELSYFFAKLWTPSTIKYGTNML